MVSKPPLMIDDCSVGVTNPKPIAADHPDLLQEAL
jgi:hypothetical protein